MSSLSLALAYIALGFSTVPVRFREKRPVANKWQTLRITSETASQYFNGADQNIGVIMGEASHGLTDIDLDCQESIAASSYFLPRTHCFGRPSKRISHWLYFTDLWQTEEKAAIKYVDGEVTLLEIRIGAGDLGAQTVFPGSVHVSGEEIAWEDTNEIESCDGTDLKRCCMNLAAATILARHYPAKGGRHAAALAIGGFLARCAWDRSRAELFLEAIATATNQDRDKRRDMVRAAGDCVDDLARGREVSGFPKLAEIFGQHVAKQVSKWLGYKSDVEYRGVSSVTSDAIPFICSKEGQILCGNQENIRLAVEALEVTLRYDSFSGQTIARGLNVCAGEFQDHDAIRLRLLIDKTFRFLPRKELFEDVLTDIAHVNSFHPVREMLDRLEWDGVDRIDEWLSTYAGAENTILNRAFGRLWLIAGVRRIRKPGCKFDTLLVLESPQGRDKSQALSILALNQDWFCDRLTIGAPGKEMIEQLQGAWIVEFAELSGLGARDIEHVKATLSRQVDCARPAYGRRIVRAPRQFICAATTNDSQYLRDDENRRFWPVAIRSFDLSALQRDVEKLWAEAAYYEAKGETITLSRELWDAARETQDARRVYNSFAEDIRTHPSIGNRTTIQKVLIALGLPVDKRVQFEKRIAKDMREAGFVRKQWRKRDHNYGKMFYEREGFDSAMEMQDGRSDDDDDLF